MRPSVAEIEDTRCRDTGYMILVLVIIVAVVSYLTKPECTNPRTVRKWIPESTIVVTPSGQFYVGGVDPPVPITTSAHWSDVTVCEEDK